MMYGYGNSMFLFNNGIIATPATNPLWDNLYAAYKAESNASDSLGVYNGTANGGVTYVSAVSGNGFNFNGTNAYISYGNNDFKFTGSYSVSIWYRSVSSNFQTLIGCFNSVGGNKGWALQNTGNAINFKTFNNGTTLSNITTATISQSTWYNIVVVREFGVGTSLYLNGSLIATDSVTTEQNYNATTYSLIGAIYAGSVTNYTGGAIDEAYIWDRAITASEVTELQTTFY